MSSPQQNKEASSHQLHRMPRLTADQLHSLEMTEMDLDMASPYSHFGGGRYSAVAHEYATPRYVGPEVAIRAAVARELDHDATAAAAAAAAAPAASSTSTMATAMPLFGAGAISLPSPSLPNFTTPIGSPFDSDMSWDGDMDLAGIEGGSSGFDGQFNAAFFPDIFPNRLGDDVHDVHSLERLQTRCVDNGGPAYHDTKDSSLTNLRHGVVSGASVSMPDLTSTGQPRVFKCELCSKVFTTSRRDYDRHMSGVHGPPVTLKCGATCKNRKDNIKRHEKNCAKCQRIQKASNRLASRENQEERQQRQQQQQWQQHGRHPSDSTSSASYEDYTRGRPARQE